MKKVLRIVVPIIILALLLGVGKVLINKKKAQLAKSPKFHLKSKLLDVKSVKVGDLKEERKYIAVLEPFQTTAISARVTANLNKIFHSENDFVKKGELLATLDNRQVLNNIDILKSQIEQAKAELESNKISAEIAKTSAEYWAKEKNRDLKLSSQNAISKSAASATVEKYNVAKGAVLNANQKIIVSKQNILSLENKLKESRTILSYYNITSPFDGVISAKLADVGDLISVGKTIFQLEDKSKIKVVFEVPQADLSFLQKGAKGNFLLNNKRYEVELSKIYPKVNKSRLIEVEAILKNRDENIVLGAYITLSVISKLSESKVLIPTESLIEKGDEHGVFVYKNGIINYKKVSVLANTSKLIAVDGISHNAQVVINSFLGWSSLNDGMKVEIKK